MCKVTYSKANSNDYTRCTVTMVERPRLDVLDGKSWWCPQCKGRLSLRDGSFFAKSRLTLQKWMIILYFWVREYPVTDAAEEVEVSKHTAIGIYQWLREVCTTTLIDTRIVLGSPGKIVEIDESLFRHKPKASSSSSAISITCLRHKIATASSWLTPAPTDMGVWDGGDVHQCPGLGYMEVVTA